LARLWSAPAVFIVCSEKMTSLDISDMHFIVFNVFD
jgi:hypothetical protein